LPPAAGSGASLDEIIFCIHSAFSFKIGEIAMQNVELTVELKIPDVTALTAASALRRRLGYEATLVELRRADYYRLSLNAKDPEQALAIARDLAENTNLFVNPNKHRYQLAAGMHNSAVSPPEGTQAVCVLITDPDSGAGEAVLSALHGRLGYRDRVEAVLAGTLWTLMLKAENQHRARQLAEQIAVTRSQGEGLLLNPHYQKYEIW
jgi:phosphoribosylformylglycinamidine (FGAM) synthase PurS component